MMSFPEIHGGIVTSRRGGGGKLVRSSWRISRGGQWECRGLQCYRHRLGEGEERYKVDFNKGVSVCMRLLQDS